MGAPTWLSGSGATISGLTMDTEPADILRAGIESMAFQAFELISAVPVAATGTDLSLSVDGGAASNDYLCQLLADLSGRTIVRPPSRELTGVGAAISAATTLGIPLGSRISGAGERTETGTTGESFTPAADTSYGRDGFAHWKKTVVQHLS
jgi:glycerol kinase